MVHNDGLAILMRQSQLLLPVMHLKQISIGMRAAAALDLLSSMRKFRIKPGFSP